MRKRLVRPLTATLRIAPLLVAAALAAAPAAADDYDPRKAGHPLRVIAYVLHPIGVAFDYLVFRPSHWVGSREPFRSVFGHRTVEEQYGVHGEHEHPLPHSHSSHSRNR